MRKSPEVAKGAAARTVETPTAALRNVRREIGRAFTGLACWDCCAGAGAGEEAVALV